MSLLKKLAITLTILFTCLTNAYSSHLSGGEISYTCVGVNQYEVTLKLFRDCDGVDLNDNEILSWNSVSCGASGSISLDRESMEDITPICVSEESSCGTGTGSDGIELHIYKGIVTLPPGCNDFKLSFSQCCRGDEFTNINTSGSSNFYIEATLDNTLSECNSSPSFLSSPQFYGCVGETIQLDQLGSDQDGDVLVYSLINTKISGSSNVTYNAGFSGTNPLSVPVVIDPATGQITFTPNTEEKTIFTLLIEEFRNGVLIGTTMRDLQVTISNCSNVITTLSGINGVVDNYELDFCQGVNTCFDINASDLDVGQNVTLTAAGMITGVTFEQITNGTNVSGTFCFDAETPEGTYYLSVTAKDDACPYIGQNSQVYTINITSNPNPPVVAGSDMPICSGETASLSASTAATNGVSYVWSSENDYPLANIANPTTSNLLTTTAYTVTLTYDDGCKSYDNMVVNVVQKPLTSVFPDSTESCGGGNVQLNGSTDQTGLIYEWYDPSLISLGSGSVSGSESSISVAIPSNSGTYSYPFVVTNPLTGCQASDTAFISVGLAPVLNSCINIYVTPTAISSGTGTQSDPTSLSQALFLAGCNNAIIKLAIGTYNIDSPISIGSGVTVEGGFDPAQGWAKTSEIGATTINRTTNNPEGLTNKKRLVAIYINSASFFRLQDLTITTDDAVLSGTSTYGIHMVNASDYNITRVAIEPGNASNGMNGVNGCNGVNGTAGQDGQDGLPNMLDDNVQGGNGGLGGNSCLSGAAIFGGGGGRNLDFGNGIGSGADGTNSVSNIVDGGAGGGGGRGGRAGTPGGDGGGSGRGGAPLSSTIVCSESLSGLGPNVAGGNGGNRNTLGDGIGFNNSTIQSSAGVTGIPGVDGCDGVDAIGSHVSCFYNIGNQGTAGKSGSGGSGGSGGGGGGGQGGPCGCVRGTGAAGGGGGGGGAGATGGTGGYSGGASFGIYMCSNGSNGNIEHCFINPGSAGSGGTGGVGGTGGNGGAFGPGGSGTAIEVQDGGNGGAGGAGGNGGNGGDGADGIALNIFWNGSGTAPVTQETNYELYNQQIIWVTNVNCTNTDVEFSDNSNMPSHPFTTATPQIIAIGSGSEVTNWEFDNIGSNSTPTISATNETITQYNEIGRYNIIHNTCNGCPSTGSAAGNPLEEYKGFHNISFSQEITPTIITSANEILTDTFTLCEGDFGTFSTSMFADLYVWNFNGAISNPGSINSITSQFNTPGFFEVSVNGTTDCCGNTPVKTVYLYVLPNPAVTGSGDITICNGTSTTLTLLGLQVTDSVIWTPTTDLILNGPSEAIVNPSETSTYSASIYSMITVNDSTFVSCPSVINFTVTVNSKTEFNFTNNVEVICLDDGQVTVTPILTGTYDFVWSNGFNDLAVANSTNTGLASGKYTVTVTNTTTGCSSTDSTLIYPSAVAPVAYLENNTIACFGESNAQATVRTVNGTAPYTYIWNTLQSETISIPSIGVNLASGDYTVDVTDAVGCVSNIAFSIPENPELSMTVNNNGTICEGNDAIFTVSGNEGVDFTYNLGSGDVTITLEDHQTDIIIPNVSMDQTMTLVSLSDDNCTKSLGTSSVITVTPSINITDVYDVCKTFTWTDGITYTSSNSEATQVFTSVVTGCDSIISLDLTIRVADIGTTLNSNVISANAIGAVYQWIDCNNEDAIIVDETNQTYTAEIDGDYAVIVTENNCTDTSECVNIVGLNIKDSNLATDIKIYPNPTTGKFTIESDNLLGANVYINNITGESVFYLKSESNEQIEINTDYLSPGVYFVKIQQKNDQFIIKLVIQ
jgi:hypothetical protein